MTIIVTGTSTAAAPTALDMIKKAMRLIGALGQGEFPTSSEADDGLNALNSMMDSWTTERLMIYQLLEESFTWASGNASRTMGSGGDFDTTAPVKLDSGFSRISGVDYPFRIVEKNVYDGIASKTVQSTYPDLIYFQDGNPLVTLYGYPVPSANLEIHLNTWKILQVFTALTDSYALPQGYQRAIEYNLALEIAAEFGVDVPARVEKIAMESKGNIKRINSAPIIARIDEANVAGTRRYNIFSDGP